MISNEGQMIIIILTNMALMLLLFSSFFISSLDLPYLKLYLILAIIGISLEILLKMVNAQESTERPSSHQYTEDTESAWKYHKAADDVYHNRINSLLVAESMLLFSYVTLFILDGELDVIQRAIALVAIILTFSWFYVNIRHAIRIDMLKNRYLIRNDPVYWDYIKTVRPSTTADFLLSVVLPGSLILLWVYLLCFSFGINTDYFIEFLLPFFILGLIGIRLVLKGFLPARNP